MTELARATDVGDCPSADALVELLHGVLDAERRAELLAHADACAACRSIVAELARSACVTEPSTPGDSPARVVGARFELERRIGAGGMGTVYRARDRATGGAVAVKILARGVDMSRFRREWSLLRGAWHPGIVRYVAHGDENGLEYLVTEWLDGETLYARLASCGTLSVEAALTVVTNVGEAVAAEHARGVIHRDLKPANIFLEGGDLERIKVLDFGLARVAFEGAPTSAVGATQTGALLGTPGYMAPEQARGERELDARVDVFALACVLVRCLTGRAPFAGDDLLSVLQANALADRGTLEKRLATVPRPVREVLLLALASSREMRPADASQLVEALRAASLALARPLPSTRTILDPPTPPLSIDPSVTRVWGERFERGARVAEGGAGVVHRARDRVTGAEVALKVLRPGFDRARFAREAELLAKVRHPHVVRYVDHGATPEGEAFLAMGWLEGPTVARYRAEGGVEEPIRIALAVTRALVALHAHGLVHRDLKPANVILVNGEPELATLVDFGLARPEGGASAITRTGALLGTPGFMAPEQIRGREVDARADLFALGCLLYFLVTGRHPFAGGDLIAVLARTTLEEPPPIADPLVSPALCDLVSWLLAKDRDERPASAEVVVEELEALLEEGGSPLRAPSSRAARLSVDERRTAALLVARFDGLDEAAGTNLTPALEALAQAHDARLELLPRVGLFAIAGEASGSDVATRAARLALATRHAVGHLASSLTLVMGDAPSRDPVGELTARAAPLDGPRDVLHVAVDELTATFLETDFVLARRGGRIFLTAERAPFALESLLGRPSPFVGRDREVRLLLDLYRECVEEGSARPAIIKARAGQGKTRLRREVARGIGPASAWFARPPPSRGGALYGLAGDLVRRLFELDRELDAPARARRLREGTRALVSPSDADRIAVFLGEVVGVVSDSPRTDFAAARRDPALMGDHVQAAFGDLFASALARGPLGLFLEDLHDADRPSIQLFRELLRRFASMPLFLLATARPEIDARFPQLFQDRGVTELRLSALTPRACARLVHQVLGAELPDDRVARLVERADGNAFYLEELVRAEHEGRSNQLPESVVAMARARLDEAPPNARQILRAAAILDAELTVPALVALSGQRPVDVRRSLHELVQAELLVETKGGSKGQGTYAFRHELLREAAYASLTERDRHLGHHLAARFLASQSGVRDETLARHFEQAGELASAAAHHARAAEAALEISDFQGAELHARAAIATGAVDLGPPSLTLTRALRFTNRRAEALEHACEAARLLPRGSARWYTAVTEIVIDAYVVGASEMILERAEELASLPSEPILERLVALTETAPRANLVGRPDLEDRLVAIAEREIAEALGRARVTEIDRLTIEICRQELRRRLATRGGRLFERLVAARIIASCHKMTGDRRSLVGAEVTVGSSLILLGAYEEGLAECERACAEAQSMGLSAEVLRARLNVAIAKGASGHAEEAIGLFTALRTAGEASRHFALVSVVDLNLLYLYLRRGDWERVEQTLARELPSSARVIELAATASLALARGRIEAALEAASTAAELAEKSPSEDWWWLPLCTYAQVLRAAGQMERARAVATKGARDLLRQANAIDDPALRRSFVERIPENVELLALPRA